MLWDSSSRNNNSRIRSGRRNMSYSSGGCSGGSSRGGRSSSTALEALIFFEEPCATYPKKRKILKMEQKLREFKSAGLGFYAFISWKRWYGTAVNWSTRSRSNQQNIEKKTGHAGILHSVHLHTFRNSERNFFHDLYALTRCKVTRSIPKGQLSAKGHLLR